MAKIALQMVEQAGIDVKKLLDKLVRTGENLYPRRVYPVNALPALLVQPCPLRTYSVRVVNKEIQLDVPENC